MFKNLRTSTKLILLCAMFIISLGVTTYNLVAEKQIAVSFTRKELIGSKFLATLRAIDLAVLRTRSLDPLAAESDSSVQGTPEALAAGQAGAASTLQTAELVQALSSALRLLGSNSSANDSNAADVLARVQQLALRIGDDSNLTLDTDLDTYYMQNILVDQLPRLISFVGKLQLVMRKAAGMTTSSNESEAYILVLDGLIDSTEGEIKNDLAAAYRGNADESLKRAVDSTFATLFSATDDYVAKSRVSIPAIGADNTTLGRDYETVVKSANDAWTVSQSQLDRLLQLRIGKLLTGMDLSLAVTGLLVGFSIIIAVMTYRHIVKPLERLEKVASTVRETKNYDLRVKDNSIDEIGRVASTFDEMLAELASARDRERAEQSELARVGRLTTMGVMTASIAHEINQPLTSIVANGQAGQRWLSNANPDLAEARSAFKKIVEDGRRAGAIIDSVRAMFKKDGSEKDWIDVNELLVNVLTLVKDEIHKKGISVRTDLRQNIPHVLAGRTQLQQVFVNLTMNAVEAMDVVTNCEKLLVIKSAINEPAKVLITISDAGTGIDPQNLDRIFDAFFTTKSKGMGLGLAICRSIIEGYGGRLWASPGELHGSVFHVVLPTTES